jgi:hypothetical protein
MWIWDIVVSFVILSSNAVPSIPVAPVRKTSRAPKANSKGRFSSMAISQVNRNAPRSDGIEMSENLGKAVQMAFLQ